MKLNGYKRTNKYVKMKETFDFENAEMYTINK